MSLFLMVIALNLQLAPVKIENKIEPGESKVDTEIRIEKEEAEKRAREVLAREVAPSPRYKSYSGAEILGYSNEECVIYAKRVTGIDRSIGYAGVARIQGTEPVVGSIGIQKYIGHAVAVIEVNLPKVTFTEANWVDNSITKRTLDISEFRGFIYN